MRQTEEMQDTIRLVNADFTFRSRGARWPSGRVSDTGVRGLGFDTYLLPCCVLEQVTFTPRKVLVIPRNRWLHPNMTEKLLTGDVKHQYKQTNKQKLFEVWPAVITVSYSYSRNLQGLVLLC